MAEWENSETKKGVEENFVCRLNWTQLRTSDGHGWSEAETEDEKHAQKQKGKHFVPFTIYANELLFKLRVGRFCLMRFSTENMTCHFV